jgi:hypothetical protein
VESEPSLPPESQIERILHSITENHQVLLLEIDLLKESVKQWVGHKSDIDQIKRSMDIIQEKIEGNIALIHELKQGIKTTQINRPRSGEEKSFEEFV